MFPSTGPDLIGELEMFKKGTKVEVVSAAGSVRNGEIIGVFECAMSGVSALDRGSRTRLVVQHDVFGPDSGQTIQVFFADGKSTGGPRIRIPEKKVDPDLIEARKLAAENRLICPGDSGRYLAGEFDKSFTIQLLLKGIKKGRELERY